MACWQLGPVVTNGYIERCHAKTNEQKRPSYGFRNRDRCRRKMLLGFLPLTAIPQF